MTTTKITEEVIQAEIDTLNTVIQAIVSYQELQIAKGQGHEEHDWTVDVDRKRIVVVRARCATTATHFTHCRLSIVQFSFCKIVNL